MPIPPPPKILHYFCFQTGNNVVPAKTKFLKFVLKTLLKGNELPIPLCIHKGEEGLTYPTVHTFQAEHPTVVPYITYSLGILLSALSQRTFTQVNKPPEK